MGHSCPTRSILNHPALALPQGDKNRSKGEIASQGLLAGQSQGDKSVAPPWDLRQVASPKEVGHSCPTRSILTHPALALLPGDKNRSKAEIASQRPPAGQSQCDKSVAPPWGLRQMVNSRRWDTPVPLVRFPTILPRVPSSRRTGLQARSPSPDRRSNGPGDPFYFLSLFKRSWFPASAFRRLAFSGLFFNHVGISMSPSRRLLVS